MSYTTEEIQGAVAKFIRSEIRYQTDGASGVRKTDVSFTDMQEAAASVFVMEPSSVFYVTYLGVRKAIGQVRLLWEEVDDLWNKYDSLLRQPVRPLEDLSELANAASALTKMETTAQSATPKNLSTVSSYSLYETNVDAFLTRIKPSVVQGGDVVESVEDLRTSLPSRIADLPSSVQETTATVQYLYSALSDYEALKLPSVLTTSVLMRARRLLTNRYNELAGKSLDERQKGLRELALELLSSKGVVRQLGEFSSPDATISMTGVANAYADASYPAMPAELDTKKNRFNVLSAATDLTFTIDGSVSTTVTLPISADEVVLRSSAVEPFNVKGAVYAHIEQRAVQAPYTTTGSVDLNLFLRASVGGVITAGTLTVHITAGTYTDAQLVVLINAAIAASTFTGKFHASTLAGGGYAIESVGWGEHNVITVEAGTANTLLGLKEGDSGAGALASNVATVRVDALTVSVILPTGIQSAQGLATALNTGLAASPAAARVVEVYPASGVTQYAVEIFVASTASNTELEVQGVQSSLGIAGTVARSGGPLTVDALEGVLRADAALMAAVDLESVEESGDRYLRLTSLGTDTSSAIFVSGGAASAVFDSTSAYGMTQWMQLTAPSKEVVSGDLLIAKDLSGNVLNEFVIQAVRDDLLQIDVPFTVTLTVPFTPAASWFSISRAGNTSYTALQSGLSSSWLSKDFTQTLSDLTRYSNAALADKNPSSSEISAVKAQLYELRTALAALLDALESYSIDRSRSIDDMIRDYTEKGADRALDTLLECRFGDFFGLDVDGSSYAGNLMAGIRDLARQDYPVDRRDRLRGGEERVFAHTEGDDPEFEFDEAQVDPGAYIPDEVGQPDTF